MSQKNMSVFHYYPFWLPVTQNWMYTLIKQQTSYIKPRIICEKVVDNSFILPDSIELEKISKLRYRFESAMRNVRLIKALPLLDKCIADNRPALVHSHFGNYSWMLHKILKKYHIPQFVSFYGADASELPAKNPKWYQRYAELFASCKCVFVEGPAMAVKIQNLGCPNDKIVIQKIGVDLGKIEYNPRIWKPGQPLHILIASSFRPKKGIPVALKALSYLQKEIPIKLELIGDANNDVEAQEEKKEILSLLESTQLKSKTTLHGYVPLSQIAEIAKNCHLFVHPSMRAHNGDDEGGSPVIITEMAACGMPVVSTLHCDIPEVIINNKTGFLARENDADDLLVQIRKWIALQGDWNRMLADGRHHIEKEYNLEVQVQKMIRHYTHFCGIE
jgi:colanic acid/amylovoran biosynthesis glycosyltransferase